MKLIAIDLDGTLLSSNGTISAQNARALKEAQNQGIEVVIATGRSVDDAQQLLQKVDLDCPIIGSNGAEIYYDHQRLFHIPMDPFITKQILEFLDKKQLYFQVYTDQGIYTLPHFIHYLHEEISLLLEENPNFDPFILWKEAEPQTKQYGLSYIDDWEKLLTKEVVIHKLLIFSYYEQRLMEVKENFLDTPDITISSSGKRNMEINHKQANKGFALQKLTDHIGISLKETVVIGDNHNDLSMMHIAGYRIAMGNADPIIQQTCDFITETNNENGVALAINRILLKQIV